MSALYSSLLAYFLGIYPVLHINCSQLVVCVTCLFPYLVCIFYVYSTCWIGYRWNWEECCMDIARFSMGSKYRSVSRWRTLVVDAILRVIRWNEDHSDDDPGCHRDTPSMEYVYLVWGISKLWRNVGWWCRHWPLGPIEDSIAAAVMPITDGMQGSKEGEWSVEGVMMMSLTPLDPRPIDQECDSHDAWCLLNWHKCVSEDVVFVERRLRWWMREMITPLTLPLPSLISTFTHFPFVFPYSYWRVQQPHVHNSHSNPLGTPQGRRKGMITHWRGHFTYHMSPSKVVIGCSHRIECVVMVACAIWDSYAWFVMIAPGRSCAVCDISQCHRMKWETQP